MKFEARCGAGDLFSQPLAPEFRHDDKIFSLHGKFVYDGDEDSSGMRLICRPHHMTEKLTEKRRHPRVRASIPIHWGPTTECLKHDRITSFSIGGCFIQTAEVLKHLTVVYIRFYLSSEVERIISGRVKYNLEQVGLGVEFLNLSEQDRKDFQVLVNHYRRMRGE